MYKMLKKYGITVFLVLGIISSFLYTSISYAETRWALACGVNYSDGSLNTMEETRKADSDFDASGYYCLGCENLSSDLMYSDLPTDYIFFFSGHSSYSGHAIACYNGSSTGYIRDEGGTNGSGTYYINNLGSGALSKMLVAVYGACSTGNGTLLTKTVSKGCKFALGWTTTVNAGQHTVWLKAYTGSLAQGNNVAKAILDGDSAVTSAYGSNKGGTQNWTYQGDLYTKIK